MATGTEDDDVYTLFGIGDYYALGGDDVVSIPYDPTFGGQGAPRQIVMDGGTGFDTLNITTGYLRQLDPDFAWIDGSTVRHIGTFVVFRNFERLYISSMAYSAGYGLPGTPGPASWVTGDTIDEIHVNGVAGGFLIGVRSGGGDDKIYLGPVGAGSAASGGSGNDLVDLSGVLAGSASAFGDEGNDTLVGSALADTLNGGTGADTMTGGAGDDIYFVDEAGDLVVETAGGGNDTVRATAAVYTLASGVERLVATNSAPHDFTLTAGDDHVTGNGHNDLLRLHLGGHDTAFGLGSNDAFYFGGALNSGDIVDGGTGIDTLVLQGDYKFGLVLTAAITGIENISMLAGSNTGFGDAGTNLYDYFIVVSDSNFAAGIQARINGANLLVGEDFTFNGGAETDASFVVYGGRGEDALLGGLGNDIFVFGEDNRFAPGDVVDGGPGYDGLFLRGNYVIDFNDPGHSVALRNLENSDSLLRHGRALRAWRDGIRLRPHLGQRPARRRADDHGQRRSSSGERVDGVRWRRGNRRHFPDLRWSGRRPSDRRLRRRSDFRRFRPGHDARRRRQRRLSLR